MIWIRGFPLPPSVNNYLMPVAGKWVTSNKNGRKYQQGRLVKTDVHKRYLQDCDLWALKYQPQVNAMKLELQSQLTTAVKRKERFCFRVDMYFAVHEPRVWTVNNLAEQIDADNFIKPCRDVLSRILGIDDKWFFSGFFEKITTSSKDLECAILRVSPSSPRTLDDVNQMIAKETRKPGS